MAVVEGRLQMRDWTDKDGNKRRSAEVIAESVYFADSRKDGGGTPAKQYPESGYAPQTDTANAGYGDMPDEDGELPF